MSQLPANAARQALENRPMSLSLYIHVEEPQGVPDCSIQPGPALAFVVIWGVNQQVGDRSLSLSHPLQLPFSP